MARVKWAAVKVLWRELGAKRALRIAAATQLAGARGAPFAALGPPTDARDRASRSQAGPAILLYERLIDHVGAAEALRITEAVVHASALVFLAGSVGPLDRDQMSAWTPARRLTFVEQRLARFPNAIAVVDEVSEQAVRFTVTECHLARLARDAGRPELAPAFCKADAHYFGEVQPGVRLDRPTTIGEGGATCPFALHWEDP